jgi:hypothetical protein
MPKASIPILFGMIYLWVIVNNPKREIFRNIYKYIYIYIYMSEQSRSHRHEQMHTPIENIEVFNTLLDSAHGGININKYNLNRLFETIHISPDGNCLFNAISMAISGNESDSSEYRNLVWQYYQGPYFDSIRNNVILDGNSFHGKLRQLFVGDSEIDYIRDNNGIMYQLYENGHPTEIYRMKHEIHDNELENYDGPFETVPHIDNIQNDRVYGSLADVMILSQITQHNIIVFVQQKEQIFNVLKFNCDDAVNTIYLKLNRNHYDLLKPRPTPRSPRSSTSPRSNNTRKVKKILTLFNRQGSPRSSTSPRSNNTRKVNEIDYILNTLFNRQGSDTPRTYPRSPRSSTSPRSNNTRKVKKILTLFNRQGSDTSTDDTSTDDTPRTKIQKEIDDIEEKIDDIEEKIEKYNEKYENYIILQQNLDTNNEISEKDRKEKQGKYTRKMEKYMEEVNNGMNEKEKLKTKLNKTLKNIS